MIRSRGCRRWFLASILVSLAALALLFAVWVIVSSREQAISESVSPDGQFIARVTIADHVMTYGSFVKVSDLSGTLLFGGSPDKTLLAIDGGVGKDAVDLIWQGERTLVVEYRDRTKVYLKDSAPWRGLEFIVRIR